MTLIARNNRVEIRALTPADADIALEIYHECEDFLAFGPEPRASLDMVLADMETSRREGGIFGGVYRRGKPIGIVDFIPSGFISLLMIARPFRGKGLGSAVVGLVEGEMPGATVSTAVQINNPDGPRFWQKMGYRVVSGPELQPDGTTTVRMEKGLTPLIPLSGAPERGRPKREGLRPSSISWPREKGPPSEEARWNDPRRCRL